MRSVGKAQRNLLLMQPGDVKGTSADTTRLIEWTHFSPGKPLRDSVKRFADWYRGHYKA
jgi:UDP-glucuronate 4-epimerase